MRDKFVKVAWTGQRTDMMSQQALFLWLGLRKKGSEERQALSSDGRAWESAQTGRAGEGSSLPECWAIIRAGGLPTSLEDALIPN